MVPVNEFKGFTKDTVGFFNGLNKNNTKTWFEKHRKVYEEHVMSPARAFVEALGERLRSEHPEIMAVPKVNKSLFRINRDTRFSPDKSPYKTNLGIFLWEGTGPRMECSGFYTHLEPPNLMLGAGIYMFPKNLLETYRQAVVAPESGQELARIVEDIPKHQGFSLGGEHYKRIPSGYDPSHPNASFLLHRGLYAGRETRIPGEFYSERFLDYCLQSFRPLAPLHRWLVALTERA